jgi:hypothetical protein
LTNESGATLKTFIDKTVKPVLILGGVGTAAAGLYAFLPRFAVETLQDWEFDPEYTVFVQHWGMMVCLLGLFMVGAAFHEAWRTPALLLALIGKTFYVILFISNQGETSVNGLLVPAVMDAAIAAWALVYFAASAREK